MRRNRVFLNDHKIIEIHVVGDQTVKSIEAMGRQIEKLVKELKEDGRPVLILDVLFELGKVPPEGRRRVVELARVIDYHRFAMLGTSASLKLGANLMLRAIGRGDKVHYFENYDKAIAWLKR